ncbi:pilus assembly protein [Bdellovibrio bacteriovorus]|uniref:Pilus assembly protein n=1 Tax=Bdellovibrio bacteriovorus TaxID=959 RepID=A0A150WP36_BDEBC|nr:pilus assembly protein [Bdellovibrio bacteriovorus]KYG66126.1 pilus assembly protein [Bdellovibrio bacteriovorus]
MKIALLFFTSLFLHLPLLAAEKNITLSLGESHRIPLRGAPSIWIQNRHIIKADGVGSQLVLKAQNEGRTTLKIANEVYEIQVLHPLKTNSLDGFQNFLKGIVGLSVQVKDGDLQLKGTLYRLQDWVRVADFARAQRISYQMYSEIPAALREQIQTYFSDRLATAKLPPQTLIFDSRPEIRIKSSELSAKKYEQIFSPFGIQVIHDDSSISIEPTVKVEITVAEVRKSLSRKWGVSWPSTYAATVLPNGSWSHNGLQLQLNGVEESGDARILASPNLLCRSGQEAEFLAGGEFPIKVVGYRTESVMWRRYGISLKVKPRADASGRISLSLETEVTSLDGASKVEDVPGLRINKVSSHFDLTKPQTIALSGLITHEDANSSSGLPWISKIPVLGGLFSSKDFQERRSELVIFVRPTIVKEQPEESQLAHLKEGPR